MLCTIAAEFLELSRAHLSIGRVGTEREGQIRILEADDWELMKASFSRPEAIILVLLGRGKHFGPFSLSGPPLLLLFISSVIG